MTPTRPILIAAGAGLLVALGAFAFVVFQPFSDDGRQVASDADPVETGESVTPSSDDQPDLVPAGSTEKEDSASQDVPGLEDSPTVAEAGDVAAAIDEPDTSSDPAEADTDTEAGTNGDSSSTSETTSAPAASSGGSQSYANTLYGYGFDVPADWYKDAETTPTGWVAAFSSFDPKTSKNVNDLPGAKVEVLVQENTEGSSLDQLAEDIALQSSQVHARTDITLGGQPAKRIVADLPSGRAIIVVALRETDTFTVSFVGRDAAAQEATFNTLLASFVL